MTGAQSARLGKAPVDYIVKELHDMKSYKKERKKMKLNKDDLRNKEIILELKNVYGKDLIYPSCHIANAMIKLKAGKTFTKNDLNVFKALGLVIKWKAGQV